MGQPASPAQAKKLRLAVVRLQPIQLQALSTWSTPLGAAPRAAGVNGMTDSESMLATLLTIPTTTFGGLLSALLLL
jgi:hypothetical protein